MSNFVQQDDFPHSVLCIGILPFLLRSYYLLSLILWNVSLHWIHMYRWTRRKIYLYKTRPSHERFRCALLLYRTHMKMRVSGVKWSQWSGCDQQPVANELAKQGEQCTHKRQKYRRHTGPVFFFGGGRIKAIAWPCLYRLNQNDSLRLHHQARCSAKQQEWGAGTEKSDKPSTV